jgi:MFS family permease
MRQASARRAAARQALVPLAAMFAVQTASSTGTLTLATMMPAVAPDVGIDARLVGGFAAIAYGCAAVTAFLSGDVVARLGTVRVCQLSLLVTAAGLALLPLALPWALVVGMVLIGASMGPLNAASAHVLARRVPSSWYSTVFTVKQTGVPIGFALAGALVPVLTAWLAWRGAAFAVAAGVAGVALLLQLLHRELESDAPTAQRRGLWQPMRLVFTHRQLRALALSGLLYVVAQHTFTFVIVTYLVERCGMALIEAGAILSASQIGGAMLRLAVGGLADHLRERFTLLGTLGLLIASGALATGAIDPAWPWPLIAGATILYGVCAVSWNGVSMGEFVRWSPPGAAAAVTAATTAIIFSGAVVGPTVFTVVVRGTDSYLAGFCIIAAAALVAGLWQLREGMLLRRGRLQGRAKR